MAKRRESGMERVASMPWSVGVVMGIVAYFAIRYGIGWYMSTLNNPVLQVMGKQLSAGAYAPFAWLALIMCWIGALASFMGRRRRMQLLEKQTGLDSLRAMSWREFEMLVGEAFRRQHYTIQETGLGGADGGIDLVLRKDGKITPRAMQAMANPARRRQSRARDVRPAGASRRGGREDCRRG